MPWPLQGPQESWVCSAGDSGESGVRWPACCGGQRPLGGAWAAGRQPRTPRKVARQYPYEDCPQNSCQHSSIISHQIRRSQRQEPRGSAAAAPTAGGCGVLQSHQWRQTSTRGDLRGISPACFTRGSCLPVRSLGITVQSAVSSGRREWSDVMSNSPKETLGCYSGPQPDWGSPPFPGPQFPRVH